MSHILNAFKLFLTAVFLELYLSHRCPIKIVHGYEVPNCDDGYLPSQMVLQFIDHLNTSFQSCGTKFHVQFLPTIIQWGWVIIYTVISPWMITYKFLMAAFCPHKMMILPILYFTAVIPLGGFAIIEILYNWLRKKRIVSSMEDVFLLGTIGVLILFVSIVFTYLD